MSFSSKPALLFIHGAWHDASTWDGLRAQLESAGYNTHTLTNVSIGARKPPVESHLQDAEAIRLKIKEIVERDQKNVMLIGHSYGGVPMSEAVRGVDQKPGEREFGVIGCVFITAYMIPIGHNLAGWHAGWKEKQDRPDAGISASGREFLKDDPTYYRLTNPHPTLYNDVTPEEAKPWAEKLREQSVRTMISIVESEAWREVACTYIICTEDMAIPADMQRDMIAEAERNSKFPIKVREIAASHSPWLKHLPELAGHIREAAGEKP